METVSNTCSHHPPTHKTNNILQFLELFFLYAFARSIPSLSKYLIHSMLMFSIHFRGYKKCPRLDPILAQIYKLEKNSQQQTPARQVC